MCIRDSWIAIRPWHVVPVSVRVPFWSLDFSRMPLIHTCYRITDIDRSVAFYEALGFQEVGRLPTKDEAVNVFMNQPGDGDMPRLELTCNYGVDSYDVGTGYG